MRLTIHSYMRYNVSSIEHWDLPLRLGISITKFLHCSRIVSGCGISRVIHISILTAPWTGWLMKPGLLSRKNVRYLIKFQSARSMQCKTISFPCFLVFPILTAAEVINRRSDNLLLAYELCIDQTAHPNTLSWSSCSISEVHVGCHWDYSMSELSVMSNPYGNTSVGHILDLRQVDLYKTRHLCNLFQYDQIISITIFWCRQGIHA